MVQAAPQMESTHLLGPLSWGFYLFLAVGNLRGSLGRVSVEYTSVLRVCLFWVMVSSDWSVEGQGFFSHCSWSRSTWVCCFSLPGAGIQLGTRCLPQAGDLLYLALDCLVTVFRSLSFSLFHWPRNFPNFFLRQAQKGNQQKLWNNIYNFSFDFISC